MNRFAKPPLRRRPGLQGRVARFALLLAMLPAIAGCGFSPLYRAAGDEAAIPALEIDVIPNREGQILRDLLIDRFPAQGAAKRRLSASLAVSKQSLGTRGDGATSWMQLSVSAYFTLTEQGSEDPWRFAVRRTSGYNRSSSEYASLEAERDAMRRSLREIADDARLRIVARLRGTAENGEGM